MNTRKDFLLASSLFAAAPAIANAAPSAHKPAQPPHRQQPLTFAFKQNRFRQILSKPARHKQCFGAMKIAGGEVLFAMNNSISAYEDYLKEPAGSMQAVAVLYHGLSIALATSDTFWNAYWTPLFRDKTFLSHTPIPERDEITQLTLGNGNPFLHSATSDPGDVSINSLVAKGSSFFICHNAMAGYSGILSDVLKQPREKVHAAMLAALVPGALAVPAGVMAINACQEAKFTYIAT
jgi:intracellular sulfur oxidation DsrE/DsrF family protein